MKLTGISPKRLLGAAALVALVAAIISGATRTTTADAVGDAPEAVKIGPPEQYFGILRQKASPPPEAERWSRGAPGLDPARARVARNLEGHRVAIAAGDKTVCLISREQSGVGGAACTDLPGPADGQHPLASIDQIDDGQFRITALLPDGTTGVELTHASGKTEALEIANNVVTAVTTGEPRSLTWTDPSGRPGRIGF